MVDEREFSEECGGEWRGESGQRLICEGVCVCECECECNSVCECVNVCTCVGMYTYSICVGIRHNIRVFNKRIESNKRA